MIIEYQNKCDNMLSKINTELSSLRDRFMKMKSQLLVTRRVNDNLFGQTKPHSRSKCSILGENA